MSGGAINGAVRNVFNSSEFIVGAPVTGSGVPVAGSGSSNVLLAAEAAQNVVGIWSSEASGEEKLQATKETVALAVADYYTGGLASVFAGWAEKQWGGTLNKLREFGMQWNPLQKVLGGFFGKDMWKTEGDRLRKLLEGGLNIPEELLGALSLTRGRSREELVDSSVPVDFIGFTAEGTWVNNKFALGRNITDLRPEDIWGYAKFFEKFGDNWLLTFTEDDRRAVASKALELGAISEHHGTIDINWTPELEQFAAKLL